MAAPPLPYYMDIILYKNFSVENKINKTITPVATYAGVTMVNSYDDYDISVQFTVPNSTLKWSNVNYMQVDGAYYFIESVEHLSNNAEIVHGRMDLLMTYKDAILDLTVLAERSTSHGSTRLDDENRQIAVDTTKTVATWPKAILGSEAAGCYVLTTAQRGFSQQ